MNMTMQPPLRYPFYMDRPPLPLAMPWSTVPGRLPARPQFQLRPSYPMPSFVCSQVNKPVSRRFPPSSPYTNMRYQNLKKSTSYPNRHALHRSFDVPTRSPRHMEPVYTEHHRSSRTKSISELDDPPQFTSVPLSKAHSWHAMNNHRRTNLSVAYAQELHISPKRHRKHSPQKKKRPPLQRSLSTSSSPKRRPPSGYPRKRPVEIPERGPIRISTLDEMPVNNAPIAKHNRSISHDRLSTKGSISTSSVHRSKPKGPSSVKSRKVKSKVKDDAGTSTDSLSSTSIRSRSSLQHHFNGSLRNDPLISAAIDDLRQFRRASSQNLSTISSSRDRRDDSLRPRSTFRPSSLTSSSSSISHSHSQSSFTSLERSEIRQLIKTIKPKGSKPAQTSLLSSASEQSIAISSNSPPPKAKSKKSSIAEELDREFNKLRALDPNREISYVTPSSICKRRKTLEKPASNLPPLPTFDELLRQVQLRPVVKSVKPISPVKEKQPIEDIYENPLSPITVPVPVPVPALVPVPIPALSSVPVSISLADSSFTPVHIAVPQSSPMPAVKIKAEEMKHEYALPIKKTDERSLPRVSHFQPTRGCNFSKPVANSLSERRSSRPLSVFNWFHNTPANPPLATFQPNRILSQPSEYGTTSAKENIYTSDIDVYVPISTLEKNDEDPLQMHLDNQTIITDDFYADYDTKPAANSSSILDDFSHLFARKHKHHSALHKKNQRCSIM